MPQYVDLDALPDPDREPELAAELYLRLAPIRSWQATASKILKARATKNGAIESFAGNLGLVHDSWEYPLTIVDHLPDFGQYTISFSIPGRFTPQRVLEVLMEALPEMANDIRNSWAMGTSLDTERCKTWASDGDLRRTREGRLILDMRQEKKKLGAVDGSE